jgi:RNA polymerase sigma-70 factor, ECF subfamily
VIDLDTFHREESGRILATLIRLLGDFDLAEDSLQEAYATALRQWPAEGTPRNPRAWLISTARHKAIDRLRRRRRLQDKSQEILRSLETRVQPESELEDAMFPDERLRLIFTCCHPALADDLQVALTLRTVCGMTTEEISRAFLVPVATMAQRLVRAKRKIHEAGIPYREPAQEDLRERLDEVLLVLYLIFNEGYLASSGDALVRWELCAGAIRLVRLLCELLPRQPEARALLGLMLLQDSRRLARISSESELVLLEEQDRSRWDQAEILEGVSCTEAALKDGAAGVYAVEAAIAAVHATSKTAPETDWAQIVGLYDVLLRLHPSPVVELNRAVAVAMACSIEEGLALLDEIDGRGVLEEFRLLPAARAGLLRRLGRTSEALEAYKRALALATNDVERRFLRGRIAQLSS